MALQYESERKKVASIYDAAILLLEARKIPGVRISESAASELRALCDKISWAKPLQAATLANLLAYCRSQAVIEAANYFDPKSPCGDPDGRAAYRQDCRQRTLSRARCFASFTARLNKGTELLIPGNYGRLTIHPAGKMEYTSGQYSPTEIYGALYDYLKVTNNG